MITFTICSNNYLAEALTLGDSLVAYGLNPCDFKIFLVDKKNTSINYSNLLYEVLIIDDQIVKDFERINTLYDIVELNTAVKPSIFKHLIAKYNSEQLFVYLDPDLYFLQNIEKNITEEIGNDSILLTPHITKPLDLNQIPFENTFLNFGIYNLGFIAIKADAIGLKMLDWWEERLMTLGFNDIINGLYVDQLWINLVPIFFEKVNISKNQGLNVAYWNLGERTVILKDEQYFVDDSIPLIFFHFSSFDFSLKNISKRPHNHVDANNIALKKLCELYKRYLEKNQYFFYKKFSPFFVVTFDNYLTKFLPNTRSKKKVLFIKKIIDLIPKNLLNRIINLAHITAMLHKYKNK